MESQVLQQDINATLENRVTFFKKPNLLYWYSRLYKRLFGDPLSASELRILEIGSGMSPLKHFYPSVMTSDIMPMDHIDYVFDAHQIELLEDVSPSSLDLITLTNVLHHLQDPISFLLKAHVKLRAGGRIIFVEPYYSRLSRLVYTNLHHEPSDFNIAAPRLSNISGPLSSANMAIPYLIFFGDKGWDDSLRKYYTWDKAQALYYSSLSYMATGGVSRSIPIPFFFYKILFEVDEIMANRFPNTLASFFSLALVSLEIANEFSDVRHRRNE